MSNRAILELLLELTEEEIEVLYLVCQGYSREDILEIIDPSPNKDMGKYSSRMTRVYDKLGYPKNIHWRQKRDRLLDEVRPVINEYITAEDIKRWEIFRREKKAELFVDELEEKVSQELPPEEPAEKEPEPEVVDDEVLDSGFIRPEDRRRGQEPPPPRETTPPPPPRPQWWRSRWFTCSFVLIIVIGASLWIFNSFQPQFPQQPTRVPTGIPTRTPTLMLAGVDVFEQPLTGTPPPTKIIEATRTPLPLPFIDDIEQGYRDEWVVLGDDTVVSEGKLNTFGNTWLFVGNEGWTDYLIEIAIEKLHSPNGNEIAVRVNDFNNMFVFTLFENAWYKVENGVRTKLTEGKYLIIRDDGTPDYRDTGLLTGFGGTGPTYIFVLVKGNYLDAYLPSNHELGIHSAGLDITIPEKYQDKFSSGGIGIKLEGVAKLLYVKIHPAP